MDVNTPPLITLVVPVFNEVDTVTTFVQRVHSVLADAPWQWRILMVDDGSTDGTQREIKRLSECYESVGFIALSRNFGKEAALSAGLLNAHGDAAVPIDVDLQDPPELILEFVTIWQQQRVDMVYGIRSERPDDTAAKRHSASGFYRLFNRITETPIPENAGDFRLIDRRMIEALRSMPERNRFMKGLYAWVGYRSIGVPYRRPARLKGESKFNYWRLWNFALDGMFSFSTLPLRIWSYIGGLIACLAFIYIIIIISQVLFLGRDAPGYASLMTAVLFFGGMQLLSIGILGEYIGRLFIESKQRPLYIVADTSDEYTSTR
ncbi:MULTISPECIES: glycosyltransferase family 2 protein [Halomonadaceae]|jgi:glycosyltransferase involved in cell wall biosynthesis|uniref:Glycosyltransferase n=1 Tax=Vreelandella titanicae TaxID=664683 RepID=A0A653NQW3_9GAMM|nr:MULTISPECIES: glycosyltransferase family 2 protein [Halomonas]MCD1586413.1 glycosyltransferase family 2 protein [Halomonas sp. IOP_14]MCE7516522.1 glycosyltransferase family 2 protein [Halomonas titanicae]NVE92401.1 glycosyltransferase family 2 protein [Halomonas titanicae]QKS22697.1 putative glycosyltransferase [Halomonas titanicae]QNU62206.1 glycosyltransferase family 2 protein [Halomonas titanicae]|tara:strand:+ start:856 stop:1815 length:960 start_codon:yes stop_codon:yes gene_type:complete